MSTPESMVLGEGQHLPDASVLIGFDFSQPALRGSNAKQGTVWDIPGHPEAVLRKQHRQQHSEADCWELARQGIAHLKQLRAFGIDMPAQRFIVGEAIDNKKQPQLYTVAERIEGRELTFDPADASYASLVMEGVSRYFLWAIRSPKHTQYLWDIDHPYQHTVLTTPSYTKLHDTGLDFSPIRCFGYLNSGLQGSAIRYARWAEFIGIDLPPSARTLLTTVERWPQRMRRKLREVQRPAIKLPVDLRLVDDHGMM